MIRKKGIYSYFRKEIRLLTSYRFLTKHKTKFDNPRRMMFAINKINKNSNISNASALNNKYVIKEETYQNSLTQGYFSIFDYQKYLSQKDNKIRSRYSIPHNKMYKEYNIDDDISLLNDYINLIKNKYFKNEIENHIYDDDLQHIFLLKDNNVIEIDEISISLYGDEYFMAKNKNILNDIFNELILTLPQKEKKLINNIYFLMEKNKNLTLQPFELKPLVIDIDNHYNDDFNNISNLIISSINNDVNGLILLHGQPGCGKTSYSQYLTTQIKRKIVFIPPSMFQTLQSPSFLDFLYENRGCCLIIEDAENLIRDRKYSNGLDCSFLLNLTDGFVSKILNMQVICTFNCDLKEVDDALLRKGRLICSYEFKKLSVDKSNKMLIELYGEDFNNNNDLTLAEIYGFEVELHSDVKKERIKVGF